MHKNVTKMSQVYNKMHKKVTKKEEKCHKRANLEQKCNKK